MTGIDKKDEALKLALEALELHGQQYPHMVKGYCLDAITAIKEALAQPELTLDGLTPTEFALRELYEFQEATGCDTAAEFKAQPAQGPLAWMHPTTNDVCSTYGFAKQGCGFGQEPVPLYPFPPQRTWVGLTDEELRELEKKFNAERVRTSDEEYLIIYPSDYYAWQRAIEAKLREKNAQ